MRVVQIVDSLEIGGAEQVAVNYANSLARKIEFSGLVATRKEGLLKEQLHSDVAYCFLKRKSTFDLKAVFKLKAFLKENKADILHAHGTSFFIAFLLKAIFPKIKVIWHEHYGARANQSMRQNTVLYVASFFFSMIFVVNMQLKTWIEKRLHYKKVYYIPNFASSRINEKNVTKLKGTEGKRIVQLANLKNPKNHIIALRAFSSLKLHEQDWSLHLIGRDFQDDYSRELKDFIALNALEDSIFLYDLRNDVQNILLQAEIGILTSVSEGFPVSLLEYGQAGLAVLSTNVGYCSNIIENDVNGLLFNPENLPEMKRQLSKMTSDKALREFFGVNLRQTVAAKFSEESVLESLLIKYDTLKNAI